MTIVIKCNAAVLQGWSGWVVAWVGWLVACAGLGDGLLGGLCGWFALLAASGEMVADFLKSCFVICC